ncbi:unnamed protein product [Brassica rapa subsp. trilocularis]
MDLYAAYINAGLQPRRRRLYNRPKHIHGTVSFFLQR